MFCEDWVLARYDGKTLTAQPLKCKTWSCELCAPMRAAALVKKARLGQPDTFLTLTVNPAHGASPEDRARRLAKAWPKLRALACREYGYAKIPFIAVFEKTKAGEPHLHLLLRCRWLKQTWLSRQMNILMGAPIVDIRRISNIRRVANYLAKYVGSSPTRFKGCKRYWCSQDYDLPDPQAVEDDRPPILETTVYRAGIVEYLRYAALYRWEVWKVERGKYWLGNPWSFVNEPRRPSNND